jgi:hypothetical protein
MTFLEQLDPVLRAAGFQRLGEGEEEHADYTSDRGIDLTFTKLLVPDGQWSVQVFAGVPGTDPDGWRTILEAEVRSPAQALTHLVAQGVVPGSVQLSDSPEGPR